MEVKPMWGVGEGGGFSERGKVSREINLNFLLLGWSLNVNNPIDLVTLRVGVQIHSSFLYSSFPVPCLDV
jgi:hypothetical protein